jgi:hypothetical protein
MKRPIGVLVLGLMTAEALSATNAQAGTICIGADNCAINVVLPSELSDSESRIQSSVSAQTGAISQQVQSFRNEIQDQNARISQFDQNIKNIHTDTIQSVNTLDQRILNDEVMKQLRIEIREAVKDEVAVQLRANAVWR